MQMELVNQGLQYIKILNYIGLSFKSSRINYLILSIKLIISLSVIFEISDLS
jgi:hypothetical protein